LLVTSFSTTKKENVYFIKKKVVAIRPSAQGYMETWTHVMHFKREVTWTLYILYGADGRIATSKKKGSDYSYADPFKDIPALPTSQVYRKNSKRVLKIWKLRKLSLSTSIYTSWSSLFIFILVKIYFLRWKIMKLLIWLTFLQNAAVFKVFKNNETVDSRQTFLNCFWNSNLHWKQFFRSSSNLNQTLSIII